MSESRITVVSPSWSRFVEADASSLEREFAVHRIAWRGRASVGELKDSIRNARAVLSWFAGDHAAAAAWYARRLGRRSAVVVGGADVARMPEIGYGAMAGSLKTRIATRLSLRWSDRILPFSEFARAEVARIRPHARTLVVPLGIDTDWFSPGDSKQSLVVTVGNVSRSNLPRKGHSAFVEASRLLPEARFVLAGAHMDDAISVLRRLAASNIEFPGFLSEDDLRALYRAAKVYVQASAHEGFGLSLAEAMACQCVPVTTRRGSLPEVVGEAGVYVPYDDAYALAEAIRTALESPAVAGEHARERIVRQFAANRRAERVLAVFQDLIHGGPN